jgi:hypothetical protein
MPLTPEEQARLDYLRARKAAEPTLLDKAKAFGYGLAGGFGGGLGEVEKFAAYTVPEFGRKIVGAKPAPREDMGFGRETLLPTTEEVEKVTSKATGYEPRRGTEGYKTAGEIIGGFGTALPGMIKGGSKALLGVPSRTSAAYANQAEKLGFKLSPTQVRQDIPLPAKGAAGYAEKNQTLANRLASKGTGREVSEISSDFIGGRLKDLGKQFDQVYKNKVFSIDGDAVNAIRDIAALETQLPGVSNVSAVKQTANEIIKNFDRMVARPGARPNTFAIEGEALQRMRNALSESARSTSSRGDAREIYNLIDTIDASVARNHPEVRQVLDVIRPQYRNSIILEDLTRQKGILQGNISLEKLGNMLGKKRSAIRATGQDIDELGELGKELKLRARWEQEGRGATEGEDIIGKTFGTGQDLASKLMGTRTRGARAIQRNVEKIPELPKEVPIGTIGERQYTFKPATAAGLTAIGTALEPLQEDKR